MYLLQFERPKETILNDMTEKQFKEACQAVERRCRQLGKDCQIILNDDGAEVAPLAWAGSSTGDTLYEAVKDAEANRE